MARRGGCGAEDSDGGQRDDPDKRRAEWPASKLSLLELCAVVTRPVAETRQYRRRGEWGVGGRGDQSRTDRRYGLIHQRN